MNILPKKRWHVRTKENIARVRKDEAEAAAKEKEEQLRVENADREARLNVLKLKAKQKLTENDDFQLQEPSSSITETKPEHVNLFSDIDHSTNKTNKEHDLEVKDKKEEYEKQIGYLTYLGQDTNESLGKKNWYEVLPDATRYTRSEEIKETYTKLMLRDADGKPKAPEPSVKNGEVSWKTKQKLDPMNAFKHLSSKKCKSEKIIKKLQEIDDTNLGREKHKKNKKCKKDCSRDKSKEEKLSKLQRLRESRLKREQEERRKTRMYLAEMSGAKQDLPVEKSPPRIIPKYNSQFNPELARQNFT